MQPTDIIFSNSNEYLQNPAFLQSDIWFVSHLDIDIYVKKTFIYAQNQVTVSGGYVQPFNSSHNINDPFVFYKIQLANAQPFLTTQWLITFDLEKQWFLSWNMIKNIIQWLPLISLLIVSLITLVLPPSLANIFRYISIIGILITLFFYAWKFIKIFYNLLKDTWIDYDGITVHYQNTADMLTVNADYVQILKQLRDMKIQKVVLREGVWYCKQQLISPTFSALIKNIFSPVKSDDSLVDQMIYTTVDFLFSTSFIWQYIAPAPWLQTP